MTTHLLLTPGLANLCCSGALSGTNSTLLDGKARLPDRAHRERGPNVDPCFKKKCFICEEAREGPEKASKECYDNN